MLIARIAALLLGMLTGAMLLIGVAIVPYWRSLEPMEFSRWFAANAALIGRLMVPLGILSTVSVVLAAAVARARRHPGWPWLGAAALFALFIAAIYPIYYTSANAALGSQTLAPESIAAELSRWRTWHWARVIAGALASYCAIRSLGPQRPAARGPRGLWGP